MMEAYGEGMEILRASQYGETLSLRAVAHLWQRGSVVRSWLLELTERALRDDSHLGSVKGYIADSGEGRWSVEAAIEEAVPAYVLTAALYARFRSREEHNFGEKMLSAMRFGFGGHVEGQEPIDPEPKPDEAQGLPAAKVAAD